MFAAVVGKPQGEVRIRPEDRCMVIEQVIARRAGRHQDRVEILGCKCSRPPWRQRFQVAPV